MSNIILLVVAHPDDEVLGCFATIAKMILQGATAYTLILSKGQTSRGNTNKQLSELLKIETQNANNFIGITKIFQENFPDNAFDSIPLLEIVKKIEEVKSIVKPNIIFTHHVGDMNIDHQLTHKAVLTATRPMRDECVKSIYSMEIPSSTEWNSFSAHTAFIPNVFFEVEKTIELKIQAMNMYQSELRNYPHPRSLQHIKEIAKVNGTKVGLNYCEAFMLVRQIVD